MKRYLGSVADAYATIASSLFIIIFITFPIIIACFSDEISLIVMFIIISVFGLTAFIYMLIKCCDQFFSWGTFDDEKIVISNIFKGKRIIEYKDFAEIGVACFAGNRDYGSHIGAGFIYTYIYFSAYRRLSLIDKTNINYIRQKIDPPEQIIKIHFTKKNFEYLMKVLPLEKAKGLERSYKEHLTRMKCENTN